METKEILMDFMVNHLKTNDMVAKAMVEEYLESKVIEISDYSEFANEESPLLKDWSEYDKELKDGKVNGTVVLSKEKDWYKDAKDCIEFANGPVSNIKTDWFTVGDDWRKYGPMVEEWKKEDSDVSTMFDKLK